MTTPDTHAYTLEPPAEVPTPRTIRRPRRLVQRWRERDQLRKRARLVSPRSCRVLAQWLRRTANRAIDRDPMRRRRDVLLHVRAAAVRTDLLEIAALLAQVDDPDPASVNAIRELLAGGAGPLYNPTVQVSELSATLNDIRAGLACSHSDQGRRQIGSNPAFALPRIDSAAL